MTLKNHTLSFMPRTEVFVLEAQYKGKWVPITKRGVGFMNSQIEEVPTSHGSEKRMKALKAYYEEVINKELRVKKYTPAEN